MRENAARKARRFYLEQFLVGAHKNGKSAVPAELCALSRIERKIFYEICKITSCI